ncbi:Ig-like domain-containing protein, partial [Aeromonas veronii]
STTLTNTKAGVAKVTATINGSSKEVDTTFADPATAGLTNGELSVTANNAKANGDAKNAVKALVRDAQGNPVSGVEVSFAVTNGATLAKTKVTTDANGEASTTLTNTTAGVAKVTATVNGSSKEVDTTFKVNAGLERGDLYVTKDNAKADGVDKNAVTALVRSYGTNPQPVPGVEVIFEADNGATLAKTKVTTDANGEASTTLTNTRAGVTYVIVTLDGFALRTYTTFTPVR